MYQYETLWSNRGAGPVPATQVVQSWRYNDPLYHASLPRHVANFQTCIIVHINVCVAFGINFMAV